MNDSSILKVAGKTVGPVGYGMLGLTKPWAPVEYPEAAKLLKTALENGANVWNGSTHYGTPDANTLHLMKYYFTEYPEDAEKVVLTMKGAFGHDRGPDGTPEGIRASVEACVNVLGGIKTIDVFACGRVDPNVPIETSVKALAELVKEGKIGAIGLSEVSASSIRRAHAVHPIASVEIEMSLFTPDPLQNGIVETCHELGIPILAYSPVGRGFLTGEIRKLDDLAENDFRRMFPRFKPGAFEQNFKLVEAVEQIARRKGLTTAQVALCWVCQKGAIPIPGSTRGERIVENSKPGVLESEEMAGIQAILDELPVVGERYGGAQERLLNA